jgi:hypothetical protein
MANSNEPAMNKSAKMLRTLIMLMGANIIAPKEPRDKKLAELKVENNEPLANILIEMNNLDDDTKLNVIKAVAVSTLKTAQCVSLSEYIRNHMNDIIQYAHEHKEVREEVSPEDLINMVD